jgi:GGDEF domain-containing protein
MTSLRKSILFMIINLVVVFNIEKFDFGAINVGAIRIDIQWFTYVFLILVILSTLISRMLQHYSFYLAIFFWLAIFLALKIFVFTNRPVFGGIYTYLTVTEMALITISILLAYNLAHTITDFENVIENATIPKLGQRILPMQEATEDIKTEFSRSRRHKRPLSVLVVRSITDLSHLKLERVIKDIQKTMLTRYVNTSLAQVISAEARRTDIIIEQEDKNGFILLCPETTGEGSEMVGERLQKLAMEKLGISIGYGVAGFPETNLTFDDLLRKAEEDLNEQHYSPGAVYSEVGKELQKRER